MPVPDAEERLRRVYDLLLREEEQKTKSQPTVRQLLLRGLIAERQDCPVAALGGEGGHENGVG